MTTAETPVKAGRNNIVSDLFAGITTVLVTVPDGMASAILAGVNPLNGLYALMVGAPVATLLAGSQFMLVANTGAIAITINSVLRDVPLEQLVGIPPGAPPLRGKGSRHLHLPTPQVQCR